MKKIFVMIGIVFLLAGCVWAGDGITTFQKDTLIQFNDVNFTIPQGYGENMSAANVSTVSFVNDNSDTINITVGPAKLEGNHTMFGSRTGYLNQTNTSVTFSYFENNRYVSVSAANQSMLLKVLGE